MYLNPEWRRQTIARPKRLPEGTTEQTAAGVIILRVDFVSKPSKCEIAREVGDLLAEAGLHQKGLKASMLLVSDREARVVTLLTLWEAERFKLARERLDVLDAEDCGAIRGRPAAREHERRAFPASKSIHETHALRPTASRDCGTGRNRDCRMTLFRSKSN